MSQNAFFDLFAAKDRWRKAINQIIDNSATISNFKKLSKFFITKMRFVLFDTIALLLQPLKGNQIKICIKHLPINCLSSLQGHWMAPINTYHFNSVTRFDAIRIAVIGYDSCWRRWMSFWDIFKQFLKFDVLFVGKLAKVVDQLQALWLIAVLADRWLLYSGVLQQNDSLLSAIDTLKICAFHFWKNLWNSYNQAFDRHQPAKVISG